MRQITSRDSRKSARAWTRRWSKASASPARASSRRRSSSRPRSLRCARSAKYRRTRTRWSPCWCRRWARSKAWRPSSARSCRPRPSGWSALRSIRPGIAAIKLLESIQPQATDDAGLWRFKGGAQAYSFFLNRFTTTDYTPEQIHQIGLQQVASIEGQMDAILKKLGRTDGTVRERIEKLRNDLRYPNPESEAARAAIMKDTNGYIADALKRSPSLFDMQPKTKVIAQPFPRFREQSAAANYNRAPLDGSRPAIFQIPLRDARMTRFGLRSLVLSRDGAGPSLPDRARAGEHEPAALPPGARARRHLRALRRLGAVRREAGRGERLVRGRSRRRSSACSTRSCSARAGWS